MEVLQNFIFLCLLFMYGMWICIVRYRDTGKFDWFFAIFWVISCVVAGIALFFLYLGHDKNEGIVLYNFIFATFIALILGIKIFFFEKLKKLFYLSIKR